MRFAEVPMYAHGGGSSIGGFAHVYDDNWQCIADIDEQGNVVASYVWGGGIDNLLAVKIGEATYYALTDVQGTVWGYADSSNSVVARWTYDAWGNVLDESVSVPALATIRYRFQGREWSAATGLVNFRMRWYDPETGRWLSKDPIRLGGGLNQYAFCHNDSINRTDADGLKVTNNSQVTIYVKPEKSFTDKCGNSYRTDSAYPILPGKTWPHGQDGISVPTFHDNQVYKVEGKFLLNANLVVNADGGVLNTSNTLNGEWKGVDWLEYLHNRVVVIIDEHDYGEGGPQLLPTFTEEHRPDYTWDNLFRTSNPKNYRNGKLVIDLP